MLVSFASFETELLVFLWTLDSSSLTVLTDIFWVLIIKSNSSLICLNFSSVRGVSARTDSSSGLSPPLFSFLFNAWGPVEGEPWDRAQREKEKCKRFCLRCEYLHIASVYWSCADLYRRWFYGTCPLTLGCGPPSRLRRGQGCRNHWDPSFLKSVNTRLHTVQVPTTKETLKWVSKM